MEIYAYELRNWPFPGRKSKWKWIRQKCVMIIQNRQFIMEPGWV